MHGLGTLAFLLLFISQSTQAAKFDIKGDQNAIDTSRIDQNIVIINLKKYNKRTEFVFTCSCDGQNCLDLNYTFTSHETILERIPANQQNKVGNKKLTIYKTTRLLSNFTGQYTCIERNQNNLFSSITYSVYFYPDDGNLFLKCPLYDRLNACVKINYRLKMPFKVPCKSLHPAIEVASNVEDTEGNFVHSPTIGFNGYLVKNKKKFECRAKYEGYTQVMVFDMARAEVSKLEIQAPRSIEMTRTVDGVTFIAIKGEQLDLTCLTVLDCDHYDYAIQFQIGAKNATSTSHTARYTTSMDDAHIDRSECGKGLRTVSYNRTLRVQNLFDDVWVTCDLLFGKDLTLTSSVYNVIVAEPYISYDPLNSTQVAYLPISDGPGLVTLTFLFSASSVLTRTWYFNEKPIIIDDSDYIEACTQYEPFKYKCDLMITVFGDKNAGLYSLKLELKYYPNFVVDFENNLSYVQLNATLISPKKPDLTILKPRYCSLNYTCEFNRTIEFQCNAHAHKVDTILMQVEKCAGLDDCYAKTKNSSYVDRIVEKALVAMDVEVDTGYVKKQVKIDQPYLIVCLATNDMGEKKTSIIVLPSDMDSGRIFTLQFVGEREHDTDVVEGDNVALKIAFNKYLFELKTKDFVHKPSIYCKYEITEDSTAYTNIMAFRFPNVSHICAQNYSFVIHARQHPHLNVTKREAYYFLNVIKQVHPVFHMLAITNETVNASSDGAHVILQSDSDNTIVLNCSSTGKPTPSITWYKNREPLAMDDEKYDFNARNSILRILRSHSTDTGLYECYVTNRIGSAKRAFEVTVQTNVIYTKKLSRLQKTGIGITIAVALLLFFLLFITLGYVFKQKRAHRALKTKHQRLLDFLNTDGDDFDANMDVETFINTKLENLEKLKFDDKKWQIDPKYFLIDDNQKLGEGNFGRVCVAYISMTTEIRDDEQIAIDTPTKTGLRRHLSFRRGHYNVTKSNVDSTDNLDNSPASALIPLLPKDARKVAVKMIKDNKLNSSDLDSLLQELKIMGHIGHHVNIIQLIGCCTSQLVSNGIVYVFVEYCSNGDLKRWLKSNANNYSSTGNDVKTSMINDHRKRITRQSSTLDYFSTNKKQVDEAKLRFNDCDLTFFCYQIAKGMEYLAKKRFLHRDLAARNILLSQNYECKISDFGLADESQLTTATFFGMTKNTALPIKWCPPEVFQRGRYEANSDVWSFGITMWEIFSLALTDPYPNVTNSEFLQYKDKIFSGIEEITLPENGSNEVHNVMKKCWEVDYANRPTFEALVPILESLISDTHKQYYAYLSENFKKQCNEFQREKINRRSNTSDGRSSKTPKPQSDYVDMNYVKPSEEKEILTNKIQSLKDKKQQTGKTTDSQKNILPPVLPKSTAPVLVESTSKKQAPTVPQPSDNSYLEPVSKKTDDTYGPPTTDKNMNSINESKQPIPNLPKTLPPSVQSKNKAAPKLPESAPKTVAQPSDNAYLEPVTKNPNAILASQDNNMNSLNDLKNSSTKVAPKRPPPSFIPNIMITDSTDHDQSGYLLPRQNSSTSQTSDESNAKQSEPLVSMMDSDEPDRYLLPRHGSTISSASQASNVSTSSTTPLKFLKSDKPKLMPRRYNAKKNENLQNNNKKANIPPNIQETDI